MFKRGGASSSWAKLAKESSLQEVDLKVSGNTNSINSIREDITNLNTNINGVAGNVTNLSTTVTNLSSEVEATKKSVSDGKSLVAAAITGKGQTTAATDTFQTMSTNINRISTLATETDDGTINAGDILKDKVGYSKGSRIVGTMVNNGAVSSTLALNGTYTIPAGYHNGSGKVTQSITNNGAVSYSLPINGTYTIPAGYHNGSGKVTQSITDNGAISYSLSINGTYTVPKGYHNGSGKVTQSISTLAAQTITPKTTDQTISSGYYLSGTQTIKGSSYLTASNIKSGVTIFNVTGTYSGESISNMVGVSLTSQIASTYTKTLSSSIKGLIVNYDQDSYDGRLIWFPGIGYVPGNELIFYTYSAYGTELSNGKNTISQSQWGWDCTVSGKKYTLNITTYNYRLSFQFLY